MPSIPMIRPFVGCLLLCMAGSAFGQASENVGAPVPAASGTPSPLARATRVPTGSVLFDEFTGRFITDPTGGFGGAPVSATQTGLGLTTNGFGMQVLNSNAVAEDFTVPPSGWSISRVRLYAYQTGEGTTSTITDVRIRISSGSPDGTVVFGDLTTNRLTSTTFSTIYRAADTSLTLNNRPVYEVVADFAPPINLTTPGTYWIAWTMDGTGASGPWSPPQTLLGQTSTGNCQQSVGGAAFAPVTDVGAGTPQGCLLILEGANLPVQLQSFGVE